MRSDFVMVLRGYDRKQVDDVLTQARAALAPGGESLRPAAREALRSARFDWRLRGYNRRDVDLAVAGYLSQLDTPA